MTPLTQTVAVVKNELNYWPSLQIMGAVILAVQPASLKDSTGVPARLYVLLDTGCSNSLLSDKYLLYIESLKF